MGAAKLVYENTERFGGFLPDWQGNLRLAFRSEPANGGEQSYLLRDGRWEPWRFVPFVDSMGSAPIYFNRAGTHLSAVSSVGRGERQTDSRRQELPQVACIFFVLLHRIPPGR